MATLAGLGVGGAIGGITGALVGLGIPEYEARRYEGRIQKGGILLSVHCASSDEVKRAKEIIGEPAVRMCHRLAKRRWTLRRSVQSDEAREESSKDFLKEESKRGSESFLFFLCALKTKCLRASGGLSANSRASKGCSKRPMFRRTRLCYLF